MEKKNELTTYEKQSRERILFLISEYCEGSQQRFSEKTGLNKASVSQYVNGKNTPSNITAAKIAKVFGVDPAWVNGFDVPMKTDSGSEPAAPSDLRRDEADLLDLYGRVNSLGRKEIRRYAEYICSRDEYKKGSSEESSDAC